MKPDKYNPAAVIWGDSDLPPARYCGHCRQLLEAGADTADLFIATNRRTRLCAHCLALWREATKGPDHV